MEPLPKERSDGGGGQDCTSRHLPQWSRSRRSGATGRGDPARLGPVEPQWSRSRRSGATAGAPAVLGLQFDASMEPLPKERSDVVIQLTGYQWMIMPQWSRSRRSGATVPRLRGLLDDAVPQWSRSRRSGATLAVRQCAVARTEGLNGAAPEGAERRGRRDRHSVRGPRLNGAAPEGAERRTPVVNGINFGPTRLNGAAPEGAERRGSGSRSSCTVTPPQWSRSRRSGATKSARRNGRRSTTPQWSRSRRSGATDFLEMTHTKETCLNGAAPEGAERRASSCREWSSTCCLNGAAPEGAERRSARPGAAR